jgi:DNA-binding beta-propeller fold protein YncE
MLVSLFAAAAIALPGAEPGLGLDDLLFSRSLHVLVVPGAQTMSLYLVAADGAVTRISPFAPTSGGEGVTSADEGGGMLFATDRTTRTLYVLDPVKHAVTGSARLAAGPDYVRFVGGEVWVTEPREAQIEAFRLDGTQPKQVAIIKVPGGPESLVVDAEHGRAYTNLWKDATVELDTARHAVVRTSPNGCADSRGIDLDARHARVFVGCREGKVVMLDAATGKVLASRFVDVDGVDIIAFDGERLFVPGGRSGTMAIVRVGEDGSLNPEQRVPTAQGAHCVAIDGHGGAYVCDPRGGRVLHVPKEARVGVSGK